jgi:uncharacterized membrane protein (DUF2068 family)
MERPLSITIIAWVLIILSALGLLGAVMMMNNPDAIEALGQSKLGAGTQQTIGLISSVVTAISGYGMLQGKNWGRLLYVVSGVVGIAINLYALPLGAAQYLSIALFLVILFFLYRPAANAYFAGKSAA